MKQATEWAQAAIAAAQQQQEEYANRRRDAAEQFSAGDKVWLSLQNIRTPRTSRKLDWLQAKYTITRVVSSHSYELDVPPGIHPVFHVDLLRRAASDPLPSQRRDDAQPPPQLVNDDVEWTVEEILCARSKKIGRGYRREALVKWVGYARPTWEPVSNLTELEAVDRFERTYGPIESNDGPLRHYLPQKGGEKGRRRVM